MRELTTDKSVLANVVSKLESTYVNPVDEVEFRAGILANSTTRDLVQVFPRELSRAPSEEQRREESPVRSEKTKSPAPSQISVQPTPEPQEYDKSDFPDDIELYSPPVEEGNISSPTSPRKSPTPIFEESMPRFERPTNVYDFTGYPPLSTMEKKMKKIFNYFGRFGSKK